MTGKQIEKVLLKLDLRSRAQFAEKFRQSLDTPSKAENERLWAEESLRRFKEMKNGKVKGKSADMVMKDARTQFRRALQSNPTVSGGRALHS